MYTFYTCIYMYICIMYKAYVTCMYVYITDDHKVARKPNTTAQRMTFHTHIVHPRFLESISHV